MNQKPLKIIYTFSTTKSGKWDFALDFLKKHYLANQEKILEEVKKITLHTSGEDKQIEG